MALIHKEVKDPGERQIITGMIISPEFLQGVEPLYAAHLMEVPACRTVAGWCLDYWRSYGTAPGAHVQGIFEAHARNGLDPDEAEVIAAILAKASEEFERADHFNAAFLLDVAERRFQERGYRMLIDDLKVALNSPAGGPDEAARVLGEFRPAERVRGGGICPLTDSERITAAFAERAKPLFRFGGALGHLLNHVLVRAGFLAFLAPPKRGKSWTLMELGLRAASFGCNVVHFEAGDMTEEQWLRRFHVRLAHRPYRHYLPEYQGYVNIPYVLGSAVDNRLDLEYGAEVGTREVQVEPLDADLAVRTARRFLRRKMGKGRLKLSCHPSGTLTLSAARTQLDLWYRLEGFAPDVLVFDYADILAPDKYAPKEFRQQQNELWKGLRALSQERHALVVTASQSDAEGMERKQLSARNFSEDMRKLAHVTGMYGLNQTPAEKREGRLRINEIVIREGDFDTERSVTLLQCLRVGRPMLDSFWTPRPGGADEEGSLDPREGA